MLATNQHHTCRFMALATTVLGENIALPTHVTYAVARPAVGGGICRVLGPAKMSY